MDVNIDDRLTQKRSPRSRLAATSRSSWLPRSRVPSGISSLSDAETLYRTIATNAGCSVLGS